MVFLPIVVGNFEGKIAFCEPDYALNCESLADRNLVVRSFSLDYFKAHKMNNLTNDAELRSLGYTKDGKVYLKSSLGKPDRIIGDVKASEAEAIDYFVRRFDLIRKKVDTMLEALYEAENKGSYLMQVLHLKDSLYTFNAIGRFEELLEKLEDAERQIKALIETNRIKNLELKKELLEKAKAEIDNPDLRTGLKAIKEIRFSWMTIGSVSKDSESDLESEFEAILDRFQEMKRQYNEERAVEIEIRKQKLQILLETAMKLNTYPPEVEQSFYKFKKLEDEWKAVGNVPKVIYGPLFEQFKRVKKTIAKYARKGTPSRNFGPKPIIMPSYIPPHEQDLYDNLKLRLDLIDEAQNLLKIDLRQANELAKDIQARWKVAGQIPDKFKSEVFSQFNNISDRIFESSYLARVVHTKYPHFRTMPPVEQVEAKIEAMEEIILKEDMNVKITQAEFEFMSPEEKVTDENKSRFSRLNTSIRKLKMKNKILLEMKRELDRLRGGNGTSFGYTGYRRPSSGYNNGGGYQDRGNSYNSDRPSYNRDSQGGGYNRGGYQQRDGGYQQREGGYNRDGYSSDRRPYQDRSQGDSYGNRPTGGGYDRYQNGGGYDRGGNSGGGYDRSSGNSGYNRSGGYDRSSGSGGYDRSGGTGGYDRSSGSGGSNYEKPRFSPRFNDGKRPGTDSDTPKTDQ